MFIIMTFSCGPAESRQKDTGSDQSNTLSKKEKKEGLEASFRREIFQWVD
jgi:hypothetical protein